jgi:hypothetical protein
MKIEMSHVTLIMAKRVCTVPDPQAACPWRISLVFWLLVAAGRVGKLGLRHHLCAVATS